MKWFTNQEIAEFLNKKSIHMLEEYHFRWSDGLGIVIASFIILLFINFDGVETLIHFRTLSGRYVFTSLETLIQFRTMSRMRCKNVKDIN